MKVGNTVIINNGIYEGVEAIITGFEHITDSCAAVIISSNPKECSRVEIQSKDFTKHSPDLVIDNKLYFHVKDLNYIN